MDRSGRVRRAMKARRWAQEDDTPYALHLTAPSDLIDRGEARRRRTI
jgi:hypothetical protein